MSNLKKSTMCKFIPEELSDFLSAGQVLNKIPRNTKNIKRRGNIEKDFSEMKVTDAKKNKSKEIDACAEYRQKILNVMCQQLEVRKQIDDNLMKSLSDVITDFETDNDVFKQNGQELERLTGLFIKCFQQATIAHKDKLKAFQGVHAAFKKEAEGLLLRGAMKPDDRPLWFDVYKAFPPAVEPKFARPNSETKPIKQILYKEDIIRAKFHAKNQGMNVNLTSLTGETQIKKLVEKYKQLQSEGVPEEELIQKSVEAVGIERQTESPKMTPINPESVSAKVLAQADLNNIFKE